MRVAAAGLTFVGPAPAVIETMGSKVAAKAIAIEAGVPVLPDVTVSDGDAIDPAKIGEHVGYPLLVKASAGGGGRGMRIVTTPDDLPGALQSARSEATAAFGDGTLFVERLVDRPRHVEVQVFGDTHGNLIHLFERDCSIQRRHQKIVEEAPAPSLGDELRHRIGQAAIALARAVGYTNAGTVEFLVEADGSFWFLEMNTRLQVEHPVTEMITGLDLVALQLLVARGEALPEVVLERTRRGHAIEVRLYAEDVAAGFLPASGTLDRLRIPADEHVRVDAGYADGDVISTHYDAMLAKVIAWAPTREEAAHRLAGALAATEVHGITTNRDLLLAVLRHPEFLDDAIDTGFLERHDPGALAAAVTDPSARTVHALAAVLAAREARRTRSPLPAGHPRRLAQRGTRRAGARAARSRRHDHRGHDARVTRRRTGDRRRRRARAARAPRHAPTSSTSSSTATGSGARCSSAPTGSTSTACWAPPPSASSPASPRPCARSRAGPCDRPCRARWSGSRWRPAPRSPREPCSSPSKR